MPVRITGNTSHDKGKDARIQTRPERGKRPKNTISFIGFCMRCCGSVSVGGGKPNEFIRRLVETEMAAEKLVLSARKDHLEA